MPHCKSHPETAIACENKNDGYAMKALPSQETRSSKPIIGKASLEVVFGVKRRDPEQQQQSWNCQRSAEVKTGPANAVDNHAAEAG